MSRRIAEATHRPTPPTLTSAEIPTSAAKLRDYFAAKMIGVLWLEASDVECDDRHARARALSMQAYKIADAMLAERAQ